MADPLDLMTAEQHRLDRFYATLTPKDLRVPTRCAGWDRKDLLAHLIGVEEYTRAGLDDRVEEYSKQAGDVGYERLNDVLVERRRGESGTDLLAEWRTLCTTNMRRLRERGLDAMLATSVGPYPLGRQAFYLASERAIHADDAGVPVAEQELAGRLRWRAEFGRDALSEVSPRVKLHVGERYVVEVDGESTTLSEYEFVEAVSGRLRSDSSVPERVRDALRVLV